MQVSCIGRLILMSSDRGLTAFIRARLRPFLVRACHDCGYRLEGASALWQGESKGLPMQFGGRANLASLSRIKDVTDANEGHGRLGSPVQEVSKLRQEGLLTKENLAHVQRGVRPYV